MRRGPWASGAAELQPGQAGLRELVRVTEKALHVLKGEEKLLKQKKEGGTVGKGVLTQRLKRDKGPHCKGKQ